MPFLDPAGKKEGKFLKFWFPVFLYSGIIFYASSLPNLKPPFEIVNLDKVVHILGYLLFGLLLTRAFCRQWPWMDGAGEAWSWAKTWQVVALCSLIYGLSDEYHQSFVPGRESDVIDLVADTIGGFLGAYVYSIWIDRVRNKQKVH